MRTASALLVAVGLILVGVHGCGGSDDAAGGPTGGTGGAGVGGAGSLDGSSTSDSASAGGGPIVVSTMPVTVTDMTGTYQCYPTTCAGKLLECGDCVDNDGDNKVDSHDAECLGPCDNTEGPTLNAGIGGETGGPCKADCYFDFGNGPGNDNCLWDHRCDPLAVAPSYPPEGVDCKFDDKIASSEKDCPKNQSKQCLDFCRPITPNGCDCFGCCTFPQLAGKGPASGAGYVWLGAMDDKNNGTCTFADILDPAKCPPCTPVQDCFNDCGTCELCLGKNTLPAECTPPPDAGAYDAGTPPRCASNVQPCGLAGEAECPGGTYCVTGCCVATEIVR